MFEFHYIGSIAVFILGLSFLLVWNVDKNNVASFLWGLAHIFLGLAAFTGFHFQQTRVQALGAISVVCTSIFLVALFNANQALIQKKIQFKYFLVEVFSILTLVSIIGFSINQMFGRWLVSVLMIVLYGWSAYLFWAKYKFPLAALGFGFKSFSFFIFFFEPHTFATLEQPDWIPTINWIGTIYLSFILIHVAVMQSRRRLNKLLSHLPDVFVARDMEDHVLFCNQGYANLLGEGKPQNLVGSKTAHIVSLNQEVNDIYHALKTNSQQMEISHQSLAAETTVTKKDGSTYPASLVTSVFSDFGYQVVIEQLIDLSQNKKAEAQRILEVQETSKRFKNLYNSMIDGFAYRDNNGAWLEVNESLLNMLHYTIKEFREKSFVEMTPFCWHQFDEQVFTDQVLTRGFSDIYEKELIRKNGSILPIELRIYAERDIHHRFVGSWLFIRDITERKKAETALLEMNKSLEQKVKHRTTELEVALADLHDIQQKIVRSEKLASLGKLVASIAHELNTPIGNALLVATSLSAKRKWISNEMKSGLKKSVLDDFFQFIDIATFEIEKNIYRAGDLIHTFKQAAVLDQNIYEKSHFSIQDCIHDLVQLQIEQLGKKSIVLNITHDNDIELFNYKEPLINVLKQITDNALQHGFPEREGEIIITTRLVGTNHCEIVVRDNGIGISPEQLGKIFDPFFTTKMGQGFLGLGLYIAFTTITELLKGEINVFSSPEHETKFVLRIPLQITL